MQIQPFFFFLDLEKSEKKNPKKKIYQHTLLLNTISISLYFLTVYYLLIYCDLPFFDDVRIDGNGFFKRR
jgi:hypothetical protein